MPQNFKPNTFRLRVEGSTRSIIVEFGTIQSTRTKSELSDDDVVDRFSVNIPSRMLYALITSLITSAAEYQKSTGEDIGIRLEEGNEPLDVGINKEVDGIL